MCLMFVKSRVRYERTVMRELIADSLVDFVSNYAFGGCRMLPPLTLRLTTTTTWTARLHQHKAIPLRTRHWQRSSSHHHHLLCAYLKVLSD